MPKICRRTRQKYQQGFDGSIKLPDIFTVLGLTQSAADRATGATGEVLTSNSLSTLTPLSISSASNTAPVTVTLSSPSTSFVDGMSVSIAGMTGTGSAALNGTTWKISWISRTQFTLIDSPAPGGVPTGGTATPILEDYRNTFYAPSRTWTQADVGRIILLSGTPPMSGTAGLNKNDGWPFRISEVLSSSVIRLSEARFEDSGTGINWVLCACCEFNSPSASFWSSPLGLGGSCIDQYITIQNPPSGAEPLSFAPWRIGAVVAGLVMAKLGGGSTGGYPVNNAVSVIINDWTGSVQSFSTYYKNGIALNWYSHDRFAFCPEDLYQLMHRFMLSAGWTVIGQRATGTIACGSSPVSGDWVTIWDGAKRWTFEWNNSVSNGATSGGTLGANRVAVNFVASDSTTNASNFAAVINALNVSSTPMWMTATSLKGTVTLTSSYCDSKANTQMFTGRGSSPQSASPNSFGAIYGMFGGMTNGQFRGRNNGLRTDGLTGVFHDGIMQDVIYFSNGEAGDGADGNAASPKRMFARITKYNNVKTADGYARILFDFAMWQGWLSDYPNSSTHNKGNGINSCKSGRTTTSFLLAADATGAIGAGDSANATWFPTSNLNSLFADMNNIYAEGYRNPFGFVGTGGSQGSLIGNANGDPIKIEYAFMGDKDEVTLIIMVPGIGFDYISFGSSEEIIQNPTRFMVRQAAASSGSPVNVDVGPNVDPQGFGLGLTNNDGSRVIFPFYQTNDEMQCAGLAVQTSAPTGGSFIESRKINGFTTQAASSANPDGIDYFITVDLLTKSLAVGDIIGEEACPMYLYTLSSSGIPVAGDARFQNLAQNGDVTFLDYNGSGTGTGFNGFQCTSGYGTIGSNLLGEVDPNIRGGRFNAAPILFRNVSGGEFRGRSRYTFFVSPRVGFWRWVSDQNNNFYFLTSYCLSQGTNESTTHHVAVGPVPFVVAQPFGADTFTKDRVVMPTDPTNPYGWGWMKGFYPS